MSFPHTTASLTSFAANPNANRPDGYPTTWNKYQRATAKCAECYDKIVTPGVECDACKRHMCGDCFDNAKTFIGLWRNIEGCWCQYGALPTNPRYDELRHEWEDFADQVQAVRGFDPNAPPPLTKSAKKRNAAAAKKDAEDDDVDSDVTPSKPSKTTKGTKKSTQVSTQPTPVPPQQQSEEIDDTSTAPAFDEFRGIRLPAFDSTITRAGASTGARGFVQNLFDWEDRVAEARAVQSVGTDARDVEHDNFWAALTHAQADELQKQ